MTDEQDNNNSQIDLSAVIDFEQVEEVSRVFFEESQEILEGLDGLIMKLEEAPDDMEHINVLFRKVHTLKGSVGAVPGGQLLGSLSHEFEALLNRIKRENHTVTKECIDLFLQSSRLMKLLAEALREKRELYPEELSEAIETITRYGGFSFEGGSVSFKKAPRAGGRHVASSDDDGVWLSMKQLNEMLRLSGELLVLKNFFSMMNQTVNFRMSPDLFERRQTDFSHNLTKICDQFQNQIQVIRKEKAQESFQGLPVLVRQTATELNKTVNFEMTGLDLLIDKSLAKDISESMVHLIRNSIDHGIEDQFERAVAGKPSIGQMKFEISDKNGVIHVMMSDDGKGLDRERIIQRALQNGLAREEDIPHMPNEEIYKFIFQPGFSTKDKVTTMSGRGVGMDVVQTTVEKYGGKISIQTEPGQGTSFSLSYPAQSHIMVESAMLATWGDYQIAVPLTSVAHISSCDHLQVTTVNHLRYCQFSGLTVPLLNYHEILNLSVNASAEKVKASSAVFIKTKEAMFALVVDRIEAQTDLVIKSFGKIIGQQKGFKGISILADEKVTYILDPEQIMALMTRIEKQEIAA
ncbi:MAG: chemotaxis protein CheW [Bdellovibrio sp.]|nr:chemotaxis protein CheW [Bdellovibrio sp.]